MKKVGIVTFNDANNYGAFLQEYALQKFLRKNNVNAEVINYQNKEFEQLYKYGNNPFKRKGLVNKLKIVYNMILRPTTYRARLKKNKMFSECCQKEIIYSVSFKDNVDTICNNYDYFIAGSDQVWNVRMTCYDLFYLLNFVQDSNKKLSYAASFGRTEFDEYDFEIFKEYIGKFRKVLVREKSGQKLLEDKCCIDSNVVLDPTFLLNDDDWFQFEQRAKRRVTSKYILLYIVSHPDNLYKAAIKYAESRNLEIILLGRNSDIVINGKKIKATVDVGPYEFIHYIRNAEAVFTTSFHGTILSINMKKTFFYELSKEKYNNNARLIDVIDMLGITDREIIEPIVNDSVIEWDIVHERLEKEKIISKKLLLESLEEA